jgi:xylulose-5-phosphate/fructose-6-phosphate phosphoketolase
MTDEIDVRPEAMAKSGTIAPTAQPLSTHPLTDRPGTLDRAEVERLHSWWRAANYLSVGQIYLLANPLLRAPLTPEHIKPRLLGHWGTTPGLNLVWAHATRLIRERGVNALFIAGPGHGGPGPNAAAWLEGTYTELYSRISQDERGMQRFFRQFSFPGGVPSHCAPETPGSLHEGGELGYSLLHAFGTVLDNPDLVTFCVVGDGEAETGPLAASWHVGKLLDPARDGSVVPVLALNGYKIANPTMLARIPEADLISLMRGYGYDPLIVAGDDPADVHQQLATAFDRALDMINEIQRGARAGEKIELPVRWPMVILRTPKGWTGPIEVDGEPVEGTFRAHQVPLGNVRTDPIHLAALEQWMRSYVPEELFDDDGRPVESIRSCSPEGVRRMSANPHSNGGMVLRDLELPGWREYAVQVASPGTQTHEATKVLGGWLRDVVTRNPSSFVITAPDELVSNRLQDVLEVTGRRWDAISTPQDDRLDRSGRVVELLSEHVCQGLLEGYLLTGRHGVFTCYEAFVHIVDSMMNQYAKWLESAGAIPWRRPLASLNYLLSSHVWRQDHNGFSHQDPGFLDVVMNKKPAIVRVYLPPDANTLLATFDHCLRSRQYVNVVVAGKQPALSYLSASDAEAHCARGLGIWAWAGTEDQAAASSEPDVVFACAGDVPTLETLAAADLLRRHLPELRVRVVNVVDLMRLLPESKHPHGLPDSQFDAIFTVNQPVIFAFHGYPWLIHRLTYSRSNHQQMHVHGYEENGTTTTPFDMVMLNGLDRFSLAIDAVSRVPGLASRAAGFLQQLADAKLAARAYTRDHGEDAPDIAGWTWPH